VSADVAAAIVFASLFGAAVWLHVGHMPVPLIAAALAALIALPHLPVLPGPGTTAPAQPSRTRRAWLESLGVAAAIVAPMAIVLAAGVHEEFPWSGDHFWHMWASSAVRGWWIGKIPSMAGFAIGLVVLRRLRVRHWAAIGFVGLLAWSSVAHPPGSVARYPAAGYVLELPLHLVLDHAGRGWSPLMIDRITQAASVLVWLFALRPAVLRRWPEVGILPLGLALLWQKDVVYYMTSVYLEPWAMVLVLLAAELALSDLPHRTYLAPLLAGAAGCFKEPAIIALPWICLATLGAIPRTVRAWTAAALHGLVALLPFAVYWAFRTSQSVWRTASLAPDSELWSPARFALYGKRVHAQFATTGFVLLALSAVVLIALAVRDRPRRWVALCLVGAALTVAAFFYIDGASVPWTGYARFTLFSLAPLAVAAWAPSAALRADPRFRRAALVAAAAVGVLQAPVLAGYLASYRLPDPARNFVEFSDSSIYYPIRDLVREARHAGAIHANATITVQQFDVPVTIDSATAYRAPGGRYQFPIVATNCRCAPEQAALLLPIIYPTGLLSAPGAVPVTPQVAGCIAALRETYAQVFERSIDGYPTGLLGVGCKAPAGSQAAP
jgi:hypothetical protein